jgi:16S rRNA (cytidine1402-2'-O)-methyltransferase
MRLRARPLACLSLSLLLTACATVRTTPGPGQSGGPDGGSQTALPRDASAADAFPPADRDGYRPPAKLAVLLPQTGSFASAGNSVRDGLLAAYYGEARRRPEIRFYDTAGTPLVSDPGYRLVRAVRAAGFTVSPIPGPCAAIAALSVAGLPSDRFCFEGFLPAKAGARRERLRALAKEPRTLVFYETGHRIEESLEDFVAEFGATREAVLARELTKLFETVLGDTLADLLARVRADANQRKGEFALVVRGSEDDADAVLAEGKRLYLKLVEHMKPSQAAKLAAELSGAPRKALYAAGE